MAGGETNGASASFEVLSKASGGDLGIFLAADCEVGDRSGGDVADDALASPSADMLFARFCNVRPAHTGSLNGKPGLRSFTRSWLFQSKIFLYSNRAFRPNLGGKRYGMNRGWSCVADDNELQRAGGASNRVWRDAGDAMARGTLPANACLTLGPTVPADHCVLR